MFAVHLKEKTKCFFCAIEITKEFHELQKKRPLDKREEGFEVRTIEMNEKVMDAVKRRDETWGNKVARRIINTSSLFDADAI